MIHLFKVDKIGKKCIKLGMTKGWGYFKLDVEPDDIDKGWGFIFYFFGFIITTKIKELKQEKK